MVQNMVNLRSKFPKSGTTIFTVMSKMAQDYKALNLSQGFPDFEVSPELIALAEKYIREGFNQYAPMPGDMMLRETIAEKAWNLYSAKIHPETDITITAGATQAIFTAISAIIEPNDEVILFTPAYDCYAPAVELMGGKAIFNQLKHPNYNIDWNEVKKLITRHTKLIIINTPQNPTGAILSAQDMRELEKIVKDRDIFILSDEVYEHIIFDGFEHQSVLRYPALAERSFVVTSFGKTLHATGWKLGSIIAPEYMMKEFRKIHQYNVFAVNHPMQKAVGAFLKNPDNYLPITKMYEQKRNLFNSMIKKSKFKIIPSAGSYFQLLDYSSISEEGDVAFAEYLTKEKGIASIPISVFYSIPQDNKVLRFCFAKEDETLQKAAEILCKI